MIGCLIADMRISRVQIGIDKTTQNLNGIIGGIDAEYIKLRLNCANVETSIVTRLANYSWGA
jgi:hypothetical protein